MSDPTTFSSKAWLLDGPIHSLPGILHFEKNCLSFLILEQGTFSENRLKELLEANGAQTADEQITYPVQLFSVSTDLLSSFKIPWYYFGSGAKIDFENRSFRFSFVKPQNTVEPTYYSESFMQWRGGEGQNEVNITEGKSSGKSWKELLAR